MKLEHTVYTKSEIEYILNAAKHKSYSKSQEKLIEISDKLYLFNNISPNSIINMTSQVHFKQYNRGDIIIEKGETSKDIFFILYGKCVVISPNNKILATIESGRMFGEMAFLTNQPRNATIVAYQDKTTILSFFIDMEYSKNDPETFMQLYKNISLDLAHKINVLNKKL